MRIRTKLAALALCRGLAFGAMLPQRHCAGRSRHSLLERRVGLCLRHGLGHDLHPDDRAGQRLQRVPGLQPDLPATGPTASLRPRPASSRRRTTTTRSSSTGSRWGRATGGSRSATRPRPGRRRVPVRQLRPLLVGPLHEWLHRLGPGAAVRGLRQGRHRPGQLAHHRRLAGRRGHQPDPGAAQRHLRGLHHHQLEPGRRGQRRRSRSGASSPAPAPGRRGTASWAATRPLRAEPGAHHLREQRRPDRGTRWVHRRDLPVRGGHPQHEPRPGR